MEYVLITTTGILAGFVAAIIGGAGIIMLPVLMLIGLSPQMSVAAIKFASVGFWTSTLYKFNRAGRVAWRFVIPVCLIGTLGSFIGTKVVITLPEDPLKLVTSVILILMLPLLIKKDFAKTPSPPTRLRMSIGYGLYFLIAIYGGFLGAGLGILTSVIYVLFFGLSVTESRATDGLPRIIMAAASLTVFWINGFVHVGYGCALMIGMMAGGWVGAHTAIKKGDAWVMRVFIGAIIVISGYLFWEVVQK